MATIAVTGAPVEQLIRTDRAVAQRDLGPAGDLIELDAMRQYHWFGAAARVLRQESECAKLLVTQFCHCIPGYAFPHARNVQVGGT